MVFKLSILTTLMLCVTANNNASDIEIYQPPTEADKRAKVMFVLDVSTYTFQNPDNSSGSTVQPIQYDYDLGNKCDGPVDENKNAKSFAEKRYAGTDYEYTAYFCETPIAGASDATVRGCYTSLPVADATPAITSGKYRCYDRLSVLKQSLTAVVNNQRYWASEDPNDTTRPNVAIGFSFFPTQNEFGPATAPVLLNQNGRDILRKRISGLTFGQSMSQARIGAGLGLPFPVTSNNVSIGNNGQKAQITKAYGRGVEQLIASARADTSINAKCSGYGVYTLTAGIPDNDEIKVSGGGRELLTNVLDAVTQSNNPLMTAAACGLETETSDSNSSSDSFKSWRCIEKAAELLYKKQNVLGVPIHTAVVSLGKEFAFYRAADGTASGDFPPYVSDATATTANPATTLQTIESTYNSLKPANGQTDPVLENRRYAIRAGLVGNGGYFAVANASELQANIQRFLDSIEGSDIPFLTTGAPTVPQDPLNPALIQNDAYYSQFKPTPTRDANKGNQLWAGNMKKYNINSAKVLVGKSGNPALVTTGTDSGKFDESTHDFWAPPVNATVAGADVNTWGSELYARMGGVRSQLPLGTTVNTNGIVLSNRRVLTNRVVTSTTTGTTTTVTVSEGTTLNPIDLNYTNADPKRPDLMKLLDPNLRQIGAVMHSSPLLISNKGQITYNATTGQLGTTNRSDYLVFGTTQGILHVVKADDYAASNNGGKEVFAFVPHEMIEKQSKAFLTPEAMKGGSNNLYYGIDGPWTAYTEYVPASATDDNLTVGKGKPAGDGTFLRGKQYIFGGLRMGGRSYYALDLSLIDDVNPATNKKYDPTLKFHINPTGTGSATNPIGYMGQSWSKPRIAWVKWKGVRQLVMFVGGGYDVGYENDSYDPDIAAGAGVYMFSAEDTKDAGGNILNRAGDLLWWASANAENTTTVGTNPDQAQLRDTNLRYSVVSEIKTVDRDNDGMTDHIYFGDLGGQVFRIDFDNQKTLSGDFAKRSTRLLNLHKDNGASPRFYAAPSFAIFDNNADQKLFAAISIGSGNLSRPLIEYSSSSTRDYDALYTIYDKDVARSDLYATTGAMRTQNITLNTSSTSSDEYKLNEITTSSRFGQTALSATSSLPLSPTAPYSSSAGWYFKFKALNGTGKIQQEKVFYSPSVLDYDLYISTYDPSELALRGDCGGGVKGISTVRLFCMPFGQCSDNRRKPNGTRFSSEVDSSDKLGVGIIDHTVAGGADRFVFNPNDPDNLLDTYKSPVKLIAQRWYER